MAQLRTRKRPSDSAPEEDTNSQEGNTQPRPPKKPRKGCGKAAKKAADATEKENVQGDDMATGNPNSDQTLHQLVANLEALKKDLAAEKEARANAERRAEEATQAAQRAPTPPPPPSATSQTQTDATTRKFRTIPRPKGECGNTNRGFSILDGMELDSEGAPTTEEYECVKRNLHDYIGQLGFDLSLDWRRQPADKISKLYAKVLKQHPFMACYPNNWATKEMAMSTIKNKRAFRVKRGYMPRPERSTKKSSAQTTRTASQTGSGKGKSRVPKTSHARKSLRNVDDDDEDDQSKTDEEDEEDEDRGEGPSGTAVN